VVVVVAAAVVAVVGVVVMDRNMLNPIPLMKGVGLVEHRNTKCIFGGLGGRGGVGAWGGVGPITFNCNYTHTHT